MKDRDQIIIRTSITGILANVFLAGFKAAVGLLSNSIAIVLDAVNNLSDAMSSLITIIGTKLAGKPADKNHPYGYGRIEYLSATIISVIVLYAGVTSLVESVKKIISPEVPEYSTISLVIVAVGVLVKILLGRYVKSTGEKVNSDSLINSGEDAILDSVISASTLVAAILYLLTNISLEAFLGAIISVVIIKSGVEMLNGTLSSILGERIDADLSKKIKQDVCSVDGNITGAYDLFLNDYGPDRLVGSIHAEVPDYYTAEQLDVLTRKIQAKIMHEDNVILTAIGFYSRNTKDDEASKLYNEIRAYVMDQEDVLQIHGFYADLDKKEVRFDVVIGFNAKDRKETYEQICEHIREKYPEYRFTIALDSDISD